jgi:hypothetical protein
VWRNLVNYIRISEFQVSPDVVGCGGLAGVRYDPMSSPHPAWSPGHGFGRSAVGNLQERSGLRCNVLSSQWGLPWFEASGIGAPRSKTCTVHDRRPAHGTQTLARTPCTQGQSSGSTVQTVCLPPGHGAGLRNTRSRNVTLHLLGTLRVRCWVYFHPPPSGISEA